MKYWIEKGGYSLVSRMIVFLFGFASYYLLVRILDKSDFGIYALYTVIITISESAIISFVQNGYIKYVLDNKYSHDKVFFTSLILNIALTFFTGLVLLGSSFIVGEAYNSKELTNMLLLYCSSTLFLIPSSQLYYHFCAVIDFKSISILAFLRFATFFGLVLGAYFYYPEIKLFHVVLFQVFSIFVTGVYSLLFINKFNYAFSLFDLSLFKKLFHFGKYVFGTSLTSMIVKSVDQLMLGYFIGPVSVALYSTAARFLNFIEIPVGAISQVVYPKFSSSINSENPAIERKRLFEKSNGIMLSIIAPAILLLFSFPSFFIEIVAGKQYIEAAPILRLLILFSILKPLSVQSGSVLEASGKPKIIFQILVISTIVNIICNYYLIQIPPPIGGAFGAALASAISGMVFISIALIYTYKYCHFSLYGIFKELYSTYEYGLKKAFHYITIKNNL